MMQSQVYHSPVTAYVH